jgi:phosphoadenosine phosphosulfate reductase
MFDAGTRQMNRATAHPGQQVVRSNQAAEAALSAKNATAMLHVRDLNERYGACSATDLIAAMIHQVFPSRIALVSSFGTDSAVLLDMVAQVAPATPVLFLDTGHHFPATLRYRDRLAARLGLTDIRVLHPDGRDLHQQDPGGDLWRADPDRCCHVRKVIPLATALTGFAAWITGRKRFQGGQRGVLQAVEVEATGAIKINPLANWSPAEIAAYFIARDLPRHELEADGYRSIGCLPCTDRVSDTEDPRAGRWRHSGKTECGIHRPAQNSERGFY